MAKTYANKGPISGQNQNSKTFTQEIGSVDIGSTSGAILHSGLWDAAKTLHLMFVNGSGSSVRIKYYTTGDFDAGESSLSATEWYQEPDGATSYILTTGTTHRLSIEGPREKWCITQTNGSTGSASTGSCSIFATYLW